MKPATDSWQREITTISFNADGTLFDFAAVMREALAWVLGELRRAIPNTPDWLTVGVLARIRDQVAMTQPQARHEEVRRMAMARTLELVGHPDPTLAAQLAEGYLARRFSDMRLFADALPALDALGRRFSLGVISNGNSDSRRCGLAYVFRFIVLSEDHGIAKPDPRLFRIALQHAGCRPSECLHVGDSLESDVPGAHAAGLRTAWLRRDGAAHHDPQPESNLAPDLIISRLTDLVGHLS